MALKIRPTPLLTNNAAKKFMSLVAQADMIHNSLSKEEIEQKKKSLDRILSNAKI